MPLISEVKGCLALCDRTFNIFFFLYISQAERCLGSGDAITETMREKKRDRPKDTKATMC